jgi:hydrogenase-4 membrane subunit HyfE
MKDQKKKYFQNLAFELLISIIVGLLAFTITFFVAWLKCNGY